MRVEKVNSQAPQLTPKTDPKQDQDSLSRAGSEANSDLEDGYNEYERKELTQEVKSNSIALVQACADPQKINEVKRLLDTKNVLTTYNADLKQTPHSAALSIHNYDAVKLLDEYDAKNKRQAFDTPETLENLRKMQEKSQSSQGRE